MLARIGLVAGDYILQGLIWVDTTIYGVRLSLIRNGKNIETYYTIVDPVDVT